MHYLASSEERRLLLLSAMTVKCCDYLPALTDCGHFASSGDLKLFLECFDHLPPAQLVVEVELRGGVLQPVMVEQPPLTLDPPSSSSSSSVDVDWMTYIRPARDRHEQNVELVLDLHQRAGLRLRTCRVVKPGDELLMWFGDRLALDLGVPVLTPANIKGHAQYICTECSAVFQSPNPLKTHIMYRCKSAYRYNTPPVVDQRACASWYSTLPLLLPPVTSSNYFRLMAGSSRTCQTRSDGLQMLDDIKSQGQCLQVQGHGHDWSLVHPPVTSESPPTNCFRLPVAASPTCPLKTSRMIDEGQSRGQGQGQDSCWRPVCLDDGGKSLAVKEFDVEFRSSATEKTLTGSASSSSSSTSKNCQTFASLKGNATTRRKRPDAGTGSLVKTGSGSRSVTSSRQQDGGEGRHVCAYCGKRYSRRYGLTIHVRTHTGHKPLQCSVCRRPFGDPSNLNKHVRLHAGDSETPYRCRHCGKVLVRRRDLERHVRSRHPDAVVVVAASPAL